MAYPDRLEHRTRSIVVVFDGGRENWHSSTWEIGFGPLITEKREEKKENMRKGNHGFGGIPPSLLPSDKSTMLWKFEWCPFHCGVGGFCYARATRSRCFYSKSEWAPPFPLFSEQSFHCSFAGSCRKRKYIHEHAFLRPHICKNAANTTPTKERREGSHLQKIAEQKRGKDFL